MRAGSRTRRRPCAWTARDAEPRANLTVDVVCRWHERTFDTEIRAPSRQTSDATSFELQVQLELDLEGEPFLPTRLARIDPAPPRLGAASDIDKRPTGVARGSRAT